MKTAVSLPDRLYDEAEKTARSMGIPRSQLYARALEEFIDHHKRDFVTERLNQVYDSLPAHEFDDVADASIESIRELTKNDAW